MSITNFDAFLDETLPNEEPKGFEIKGERFDLPAVLPAKAMLVFSRYIERNRPDLAADTFYLSVLGQEQYDRLLDLVPDLRTVVALIDKIAALYTGDDGEERKNAPTVQRKNKK